MTPTETKIFNKGLAIGMCFNVEVTNVENKAKGDIMKIFMTQKPANIETIFNPLSMEIAVEDANA